MTTLVAYSKLVTQSLYICYQYRYILFKLVNMLNSTLEFVVVVTVYCVLAFFILFLLFVILFSLSYVFPLRLPKLE